MNGLLARNLRSGKEGGVHVFAESPRIYVDPEASSF